jgi:hypothetical protein
MNPRHKLTQAQRKELTKRARATTTVAEQVALAKEFGATQTNVRYYKTRKLRKTTVKKTKTSKNPQTLGKSPTKMGFIADILSSPVLTEKEKQSVIYALLTP